MVTLEQTSDIQLVRNIITHPRVYPMVSDDGSPAAEDYVVPPVTYVLVKKNSMVAGCFCLVPINAATVEIHTCLLPEAYGECASYAARMMSGWIWDNTKFNRIITNVPDYNRLALRFAERSGMERFGINPQSYLKNGRYEDQIMLGMTRPKAQCQEVA